jgi:hypothetical protein
MRSRLATCFFVLCVLTMNGQHSTRLSLVVVDQPLEGVFKMISEQTGYYFSYNADIIPQTHRFNIHEQDADIRAVLTKLLLGTGLDYQIIDDQVILTLTQEKLLQIGGRRAFTIIGKVRELGTLEPIANVNVFLSETNMGGSTDIDGNYRIENVPFGYYEVSFSHLAFEMQHRRFELSSRGTITINVEMELKTILLDSVEVISRKMVDRERRERMLRIFNSEFLGKSSNAVNCVIINPDVLEFDYDRGSDYLEAFASSPLEIVNANLGYSITYYFERFVKDGNLVDFYGKARFHELPARSAAEYARRIKHRRQLYQGSFLHFRRALVEDRLRQEGFEIALVEAISQDSYLERYRRVARNEIVTLDENGDLRVDFEGYLLVSFKRKPDEFYEKPDYDVDFRPNWQKSYLSLPKGPVTIRKNGRMEYPGFATLGYWYWERLADLLPENYDPKTSLLE